MSPESIERIFALADELQEENGAYFPGGEARPEPRGNAGFDLMPVVIDGEEWERIEAGLTQRVRAWNSFLHDIYHGQEILKAGVIPYEAVLCRSEFSSRLRASSVTRRCPTFSLVPSTCNALRAAAGW